MKTSLLGVNKYFYNSYTTQQQRNQCAAVTDVEWNMRKQSQITLPGFIFSCHKSHGNFNVHSCGIKTSKDIGQEFLVVHSVFSVSLPSIWRWGKVQPVNLDSGKEKKTIPVLQNTQCTPHNGPYFSAWVCALYAQSFVQYKGRLHENQEEQDNNCDDYGSNQRGYHLSYRQRETCK